MRAAAVALLVLIACGTAAAPQPAPAFAYRLTDLASGRVMSASREDLLRTPVLPGSLAKIATLVAALESGAIQPSTRIACTRRLEVDGRRLDCSHPDVGRPMGPAEALAHSCNSYFATVARRLRREALDRAFTELGLPRTDPSATVESSALGLAGRRLPPEQWLAALVRLATSGGRVPGEIRPIVLEGLRGAAEFGTAAAFRDNGVSALAKTGTAAMPGGGFEGLVVAVSPADHPARSLVAMAPGASGRDAARLAVERLVREQRRPVVRVGVATSEGRYRVVTLPIEDYVSRVVSAESDPASGPEALRALAIVARTFAAKNKSRHAHDGFDLCDLTHCQVMGTPSRASEAATRATAGQLLLHQGDVADVYYTASCGGHTERPSAVWPGSSDPPYLPSLLEPECAGEQWHSEIRAADLLRALVVSGRRGDLVRDLKVVSVSASGRVAAVLADGVAPPQMTGEEIRLAVGRTIGWQVLKSTLFRVERSATGYRFNGSGRGHGVGLCMAGSARMAARGQSARAILERYFPGTEIHPASVASQAGVSLPIVAEVPVSEQRERSRIEQVGAAALAEYASKLRLPAPGVVRVVAHPTVEAYMRATGQAWWTTGSTRGLRIDLVPLAVLRQRGVLESTLRHELAHAVTADRLRGSPIWVQEAVAMDLAGDRRFPATSESKGSSGVAAPRQACPSDAEWRAVSSGEALERAYQRAAACYAAQRSAGAAWDQVR